MSETKPEAVENERLLEALRMFVPKDGVYDAYGGWRCRYCNGVEVGYRPNFHHAEGCAWVEARNKLARRDEAAKRPQRACSSRTITPNETPKLNKTGTREEEQAIADAEIKPSETRPPKGYATWLDWACDYPNPEDTGSHNYCEIAKQELAALRARCEAAERERRRWETVYRRRWGDSEANTIAERNALAAENERLREALQRMLSDEMDWDDGEIGVGHRFRYIARRALEKRDGAVAIAKAIRKEASK